MFDDLMDDHGEQMVGDYVIHDLNSGQVVNEGCHKKLRLSLSPDREKHQEFQDQSVKASKPSTASDANSEGKTHEQPAGSQYLGEEATPSATTKKNTLKENLITYLQSDGDGKLVLQYFHDNKRLEAEIRALLTRTIIKKFKDDALRPLEVGQKLASFTIEKKLFIALSEAIESLFPGELASTYYSPFRSENGITVQIGGTLWWHYNYTREKLRSQNLLDRPPRSKKKKEKPVPQPPSDEIKVALNSLQNSLDSTTCRENWRITHNARLAFLMVDNLSITDYVNKFPCLRVQDGKQLLELDFDILKPGKSHNLRARWPIVKKVLIKQFEILAAHQKKKKKLSIDDLAYIKLLPTLESERQDAVVMYLLQLLIGIGNPGKKRINVPSETPKKYQSKDIRDSFIYQVEKVEDIDEEIKRLKVKLVQRKETLQPLTLIVGPLINIDEAYVVVDEQKYKVPSCLDALELTFKAIFALDSAYPKPSFTLWQFIQHAVFDIQVAGDSLTKSIKELLGLVRQAFVEAETPNI